jgi:hypothetical protein
LGGLLVKTGTLKNIFLHILKSKWTWLVLCFTGLVTVYVCASFSFAKYVERQTSDTSTDVATFIIEDDLSEKSYNLAISGSSDGGLTAIINVVNKSSVPVNYSVTVENVTKNLPLVFNEVSTKRISAGGEAKVEVGVSYTGDGELSTSYCGMIDIIRVTVVCVQAE